MNLDKKYKILIVDDQPDNTFLLEMLLKRQENFEASICKNGQEAVEYVDSHEVDLVLMDVMMPVLDGVEATKKIRENFSASVLPIIMVTTLSDTDNLVKSFEAGANDYVSKPVEWYVLKARICTCLAARDSVLLRDKYIEKTKALNHKLKQFSFSVAHDIRNPLAHIRVLCSAIKDELIPMEEGIPQVDELAEKAYVFLDSILEHSAYGKSEDIKSVNMNDLVADVSKFLGAEIESKEAQISSDSLPTIRASYGLLFQLFLNLIGNSLKYSCKKGPIIEILSDLTNDYEIISVKDDGAGMSEEDLELVMDPLTRGSNSEGTTGSGLGLSLASNIMEELHGKMELESELGKGTCVKMYFPKELRV